MHVSLCVCTLFPSNHPAPNKKGKGLQLQGFAVYRNCTACGTYPNLRICAEIQQWCPSLWPFRSSSGSASCGRVGLPRVLVNLVERYSMPVFEKKPFLQTNLSSGRKAKTSTPQ